MNKRDVVNTILNNKCKITKDRAESFACANIALCKYWGKRDDELNLPVTSSLSISLADLGTKTAISLNPSCDMVFLNNQPVDVNSRFWRRIHDFLELFRPEPDIFFTVDTQNSVPTSAGLASSASGFAALTLALNQLLGWRLESPRLSILARLGSGSACRSLGAGFVEWHAGVQESGMDSFATALPNLWPELRVGIVEICRKDKALSSRNGMRRTVETSDLFAAWPKKVENDLSQLKQAITHQDFTLLGRVAESNALSMHATMFAAWPPVLYWLPETLNIFHRVWSLRQEGLQIYFTIDAGPNVKLLFLRSDEKAVHIQFPGIKVVVPFADDYSSLET